MQGVHISRQRRLSYIIGLIGHFFIIVKCYSHLIGVVGLVSGLVALLVQLGVGVDLPYHVTGVGLAAGEVLYEREVVYAGQGLGGWMVHGVYYLV